MTQLNFKPPKIAGAAAPPGGTKDLVIAPPGQAAASKPKARSLWNQLTDVATGVVPGIARFGSELVTSTVGMPVRHRLGVRKGQPINFNPASEEWNPTGVHAEQSFGNTYGDITHPSRFAKAVKEGRIVDKLLEDAGNISLVAGPVSSGLTAGAEAAGAAGYTGLARGLEIGSTGAQYVHSVAGPIADSPISVPRKLLNLGGEGTRAGIASLAAGDGLLSATAQSLRERMPRTLTEHGRVVGDAIKVTDAAASRAKARASRELFSAGVTEKDPALRITDAEQGAATAILSGVGHADQILRTANPHLSGEDVRLGHVLRDIPEQTFTADIAGKTREYLDGTIDPESKARIDRYMEAQRSITGKSTERALAGDGRLGGPLDPRHLGPDPIDEYVTQALEDPELNLTQAEVDDMTQRRAGGERWDSIEQDHPVLTDVLDNQNSYGKPWRPAMRAMALGNENLKSALPMRPEDLMAMGMDQPTYFSSAPSELAQPRLARLGSERTNLGMGGLRGLSSEHMSTSAEYLPYSARTMAEGVGYEAGRTTFNEHMVQALGDAKLPTVAGVLGVPTVQVIVDAAKQEAKAQRFSVMQTRRLVGQRLNEALAEAGHSTLIGDLSNPKPGDFNAGADVALEDIRADTPAIETSAKASLTPRFANRGGGVPGGVMDWINRKFKSNVLPFSIRWQLGDAVGGAMMSWAGGGINPLDLARSMRELKHLDPVAQQQLFEHPDFADASLSQGERQVINLGPDAPTPKTPIGKYKAASFRLNNKINDMNRHGYLLAKTDKLLSEHGLSVEKLGSDEAAWAQPEVQQSLTAAVKDATKVMGSFDEMTPFEQRYMKRIFPFWAWNRHITQLAWHMAVDNPARAMWTMRLGSYGSDPDSDLPSYLKGGIPLPFGGLTIPTSGLNPFNDIVGGEPFYSPPGMMRAASPAIKLGVAATTGMDLNRGGLQFTRPRGSGNAGGTTPLALRPLELAYQAAKTVPFSRVAMDLLPTKTIDAGRAGKVSFGPVARYGSGARIAKYGTTPRWQKALPLFGVPLMPTPKTKG